MISNEEYYNSMLVKYDELKAKVEILEKQIRYAAPRDKLDLYENVARLHEKKRLVSQMLIEMNTTPDSKWQRLKLNMELLWSGILKLTSHTENLLKNY